MVQEGSHNLYLKGGNFMRFKVNETKVLHKCVVYPCVSHREITCSGANNLHAILVRFQHKIEMDTVFRTTK
jgi:hypothetical protein